MIGRRLLAAACATGLCVAPAYGQALDHNPSKAADPVGDSNGAPDITGVTVANDLSGTILFVVEVANRTGFVASDDILIYIDSDRSALTGYPERATAELSEARKLIGDDRYSSIAHVRAVASWGVPEICDLAEITYFAGLRKAGVPEE